MGIEYLILIGMWIFGFFFFMMFIPRKYRREGILALMVFQAVIWFFNLPAFEFGLLSAPVREFPKAHDLPITINYFFYPLLFSIYFVHRKKLTRLPTKWIYTFIWIS